MLPVAVRPAQSAPDVARRVRIHADFRDDLRAQLAWIADHQPASYIDRLRDGLDEAIELIGEWPAIGVVAGHDGRRVLRTLILRSLPFVIWYGFDAEGASSDVWLLRLFHSRQDRPRGARKRKR